MFLYRGGYEVVVTAILKRVPLTIDRSDNSSSDQRLYQITMVDSRKLQDEKNQFFPSHRKISGEM